MAVTMIDLYREIRVTARTLKPEAAMGHPEADDFPLRKGRERLMQSPNSNPGGVGGIHRPIREF
jgi:hypothetical protein